MKNSITLMAQYNVWATNRLCQALEPLSAEEWQHDLGLFFTSVCGTLNHLLVGEHHLWYPRFAHGNSPVLPLNTVLHTDKNQLLDALQTNAPRWLRWLAEQPETLPEQLSYRTASGQPITLPYAPTLMHVFNHGTHHRGQVSAALSQLGYPSPELDLVYQLVEQCTP